MAKGSRSLRSGVRGLTETRDGRLTVIVIIGGSLLVIASFANVWMANVADDQAEDVRRALRTGLVDVTDETLAAFPETSAAIERAAARALAREPAVVVGATQPDGDEVVVAVESRWGWQIRCVEAELRGAGTVLTDADDGPC
ncbi:MAG TPA: hypothetical protein VF743_08095 [Acidimicrobiales bacterium]